jgi:hypothetical protein
MGAFKPKALTAAETAIMRIVTLFRLEMSKKGGLSDLLLFFSFIFLFWLFKCSIALL